MARRSGGSNFAQFELFGAEELEAALRTLPKNIGKAALKRALVNAAKPVAEDARRSAPVRSGLVRDNITVSTKLSKRQARAFRKRGKGEVTAFLGAAPSRRAHLIEFGTGPRAHRKSGESKSGKARTPGRSTGQAPAQPFMRPAWERGKQRILDDFSVALWKEIEKAVARQARKALRAAGRAP